MQVADVTPGLSLVHRPCCLCRTEDADPVGVGEDFEYKTSPDIYVAMQCRSCGVVYLNPRPAMSELDRIYPPSYHAFDFTPEKFGLAHTVRRRLEAHRLLSYCRGLAPDARILDAGCGDGFHLQLLRKFGSPGWRIEGIDASERAVTAARNAGLTVHHGTLEGSALPRASYDLVLLIATIEHVDDPAGLLKAVNGLLRPGGIVTVITDNTATLDFRIFKERHWGGYHFPRHWNLFNRSSLKRLAESCGLQVREITTTVSPVNWVYSIRNRLVDRQAPGWLIEQFSLKSPLSLGLFTVVDTIFQVFGRGALLRMIAVKP